MIAPELRITDAEAADCPRRDRGCAHCKGSGECRHAEGIDPDWCCVCGGAAWSSTPALPGGASARIGAILVDRLPHLRHAVWPPKVERAGRGVLAAALGMIGAVP